MTESTGLPGWRPGTKVRYWAGVRVGDGEIGLTQGTPVVADGVPAVLIADRDGHTLAPLDRVEWLAYPSTASWWEFFGEDSRKSAGGGDT